VNSQFLVLQPLRDEVEISISRGVSAAFSDVPQGAFTCALLPFLSVVDVANHLDEIVGQGILQQVVVAPPGRAENVLVALVS
jgi:hypothetical protein